MKRYTAQIALIVALAVSLGISFASDSIDGYYLDIALNVGINIILAVSLNLVNGHTGQFSLGHAAFMTVLICRPGSSKNGHPVFLTLG